MEDVEFMGQRAGGAGRHPEEALQQQELRGQPRYSDDAEVQVLTDGHKDNKYRNINTSLSRYVHYIIKKAIFQRILRDLKLDV